MTRGERVTSHDVAREAGVSQAAVSLVLGGKSTGRVAAPTAERVRAAAARLGYLPNPAARSLRLGTSRTVLLVTPTLATEYFGDLYDGVARVASEEGFGVVLYPSPGGVGEARDPFVGGHTAVDGILATSMAPEAVNAIRRGRLPLVMLDSDPAAGPHTVNLDLESGVREAVEHLVGLGHRRFLHLAANVPTWTFTSRGRAVTEHLAAAGADTLLHTERTPVSVAGGLAAATAGLQVRGEHPTAVICDDDRIAAGAYKALRQAGLDVPTDVSVLSLDDFTVATAVQPELTALRFDASLLGERGMRALLAVIAGREVDEEDVPVELIVRGSTTAVDD